MMKIKTSAPSNIALIKYMGKIEGLGNRPTNASLSYTLEHLRTFVEIELNSDLEDRWQPLQGDVFAKLDLSQKGQEKFLKHFHFLKEHWKIKNQFFTVKSANNFPSDCGLASSASSFAALTKAASLMFQEIQPLAGGLAPESLSPLSRRGSGSSCRSFFSPWALWKEEGAESVKLDLQLHSAVILLENGKKTVSSSEAHTRVLTSPRFQGRIQRAELKLKDLLDGLRNQNWKLCYEIIWDEFWDMHDLFHSSVPAFGYMTPECKEILQWMERQWKKTGHGPWVTLDAGPNIHLLFPYDELSFAKKYLEEFKRFQTVTSWGNS